MKDKKIQLFFLPFAGGNSSSFHQITKLLDERIEIVCVEYAGRLSRCKEPYITEYQEFLKDVADYINARRNGLPFSILGYSLGSALAFDLITNQMLNGKPEHCFLCARGSLKNIGISQRYHELSDEEFVQKMVSLGGINERILENKRFLEIYMKPVRMDYKIWSQYRYIEHNCKIACDTTIMYSPKDPLSADVREWRNLIDGNIDFYELGENHFFMNQYYKEMAEIINQHLKIKDNYEDMLELEPYSLEKEDKQKILSKRLISLSRGHYQTCGAYKKILDAFNINFEQIDSYYQLPFLPVRLFKELDLRSVPEQEIVKTMTSSGTTGQQTSKIYVDKKTANYQQKTLVKIVSSFTGNARMPMLIIDCPSVVKNRAMFSARGAGILGFSIFGRDKLYALNDNMQLDIEKVSAFLEKHKGERIFLFGFTFMIWQHFYKELMRLREKKIELDLSNGILIHGGGWKKLASEAVSQEEFHSKLREVCGLDDIHDYYGMVEQTGCIYMQCECGHLHASIFSDVIIRKPEDFSICEIGEKGIIQVVSAIPESYPGHSLLTEDEGMILGEDDCPCGRKGKYFTITGRLKNAEIRGCSDTYAAKF